LQLCVAHRGLEWFEFKFIGKAVHGGRQKEGVNAISKAVKFINALDGELAPRLEARRHPLLGSATLNYGVISGGTQLSTVAGECVLLVDRRFLPAEPYEGVVREFQDLIGALSAEDEDFRCEMRLLEESAMGEGFYHLPLETPPDHPFARLCLEAARAFAGGGAEAASFPAWTDAALLSGCLGIPTVVIGPGDVECCHSRNEFVPVGDLMKAYLIYANVAAEFCG
jgi:acetylornithine deacetylase/succinyl-diaminopimelate desuccinylase